MVIGVLFNQEKPKHRDTWTIPKTCYEGDCCPRDHFTDAEIEDLRADMVCDFSLDVEDEDALDDVVEERLDEVLCNLDWFDLCEERKGVWEELTWLVSPPRLLEHEYTLT